MLGRLTDTIAACITGPGPAAVAVVRISGPQAWLTAESLFKPWPKNPESHRAYYGELTHGEDALMLLFEAGRSYTGEETVEISLHGSSAGVRLLLEEALRLGVRGAEQGEFTKRAFMNGKIDLAQAEGVKATIEAATSVQMRQASSLREGVLSSQISKLRRDLTGVLAAIEASTDFSEEVGEVDRPALITRLAAIHSGLQVLVDQAPFGRLMSSGFRVAIVGLPNAGKSSLLNAILRSDRAIVTPIAGTTRDTLEERVEMDGIPCVLIDTAGLRESSDEVETMGIERARAAAEAADLVWHVFDSTLGWQPEDQEVADSISRPTIKVGSKADLAQNPMADVSISSLTAFGLPQLVSATRALMPPEGASPILPRHEPLLAEAMIRIEEAQETLGSSLPPDLAVVMIQSGIRLLGEVTGETTPPDIIHQIFSDFCIGK